MQLLTSKSGRKKKKAGRARKGEGTLRLRGNTYWYRIPNPIPGGKPLEGSCNTTDHTEAILAKNEAIRKSRLLKPADGTRPVEASLISDLLDDYEEYRRRKTAHRESGESTYDATQDLANMRNVLGRLRKFFGTIKADTLTTALTAEYRKRREEKDGVLFSTVNLELRTLRAALRRALRSTPPKITQVPFIEFPSEKTRVREGFIERGAAYEKILDHLPMSQKALFVCAMHVGARGAELKKITWDQVDLEEGIITLRAKTTKNADTRNIPIWGEMRFWLKRQKEIRDRDFPDCQWVFFFQRSHPQKSRHGQRLCQTQATFRRAADAAGYSGSFHDTRRSAIKYAVQDAGIDSTVVRHMSGHRDPTVFDRYNISSKKEMKNLGQALDAHQRKPATQPPPVIPIRKAG